MATAVLYCQVPEIGGATTFSRADVFVKPKKNTATFFSYYNAGDNRMDVGYTEHSGCPVVKGEKWISVAWMREGVTSKKPWDIYDPSGVEILDTEKLEKESLEEEDYEDEEEEGICMDE